MMLHHQKSVTTDVFHLGGSDRRLALFENVFPVPRGISYNSYLIRDEKTVLLDTVDHAVSAPFFAQLEQLLDGRTLDYLVIQHMEPDHCAALAELLLRYPTVQIIGNAKTAAMLGQFFTLDLTDRLQLVKEGDTLSCGRHTLQFIMAPMVHWPEVMVTYDAADKILFSADAFGTFGALGGSIFADELDFPQDWLPDARRYYANIVGKYGAQVQSLLKKAAALDIAYLCPLHGPVWRKNIGWFIEKYDRWSSYAPEEQRAVIFYGSVYGGTEQAAEALAGALSARGVKNPLLYDVSVTDCSVLVAEAFRCSHLIFAAATYNGEVFSPMDTLLRELSHHKLQNRAVALIENGSWAPMAGKLMRERIAALGGIRFLGDTLTLRSTMQPAQDEALSQLADAIAVDLLPAPMPADTLEPQALFSLSYGLFLLTTAHGGKENGCIINTVMQVTDSPLQVAIAVNKQNLTHHLLHEAGRCTLSVLAKDTPFAFFAQFGFQSGQDVEKFTGGYDLPTDPTGLRYTDTACARLSGRVVSETDCGSHTLFLVELSGAKQLRDTPPLTYADYHAEVKPKPQPTAKKGYICKICGYVHEGALPPDFVCPICKHGAADFEPL